MKLEFLPNDFHCVYMLDKNWPEEMARIANEKLEQYIKEHGQIQYGKVVRGVFCGGDSPWYGTHKAILINIEEIPKVECEHEPVELDLSWKSYEGLYNKNKFEVVSKLDTLYKSECSKCGKQLKAKWELA